MGFKSQAQMDKFKQLVKEGKISKEIYDKMAAETDRMKLLPRAPKKPKSMKPKKARIIR